MLKSLYMRCTIILVSYARRLIGNALLQHRTVPVLILEGARAVGKTTMMRKQIVPETGYSYTSLADRSTLDFASQDLVSWLRQLSHPAIIDEAQLLPQLPVALKELVDELGVGNHFILTGSAAIGRTGLGGADPLTRRSRRLTMQPLTPWEIGDQSGSIVDALFEGEPVNGQRTTASDESLLANMLIGGFPAYVYPDTAATRGQIQDRIRSDMVSLLGDAVLPDTKFDATIARTALDGLLRTPGGIFNASRLAQNLDLDRRTIDRYLSIFERLFLIHWLPNLATTASRQNHTRSKIHPVDTSFAVESLTRAGVDILQKRETYGALLESYVVNQIVAGGQWASTSTQAYYWRQASNTNPEVDLVLVDSRERALGIEVKASREVDQRDLDGLRALQRDRGLHRGFVVYTGDTIRQLDADIWALPVQALSDGSAFAGAWNEPAAEQNRETISYTSATAPRSSYDATLFLSYVHDDDKRAGGRIVQFARDLVETYAFLYGHELQLFIDRDDIRWGENWATRLGNEIEATSFLLSVVTPRYLKSEACRSEVLSFASAAKKAQDPKLMLPLQWVDVTHTDVVAPNDPVRVALLQTQYEDVTEIRRITPGSIEYDELLERVAARLKATVDNRSGSSSASPVRKANGREEDQLDLITVLQRMEDRRQELERAAFAFKQSFESIGLVFNDRPPLQAVGTHPAANALADLGKELVEPTKELESATRRLGLVWQEYDSDLARFAQVLSDYPDEHTRQSVFESLDALARSLEVPQSETMEQQLRTMGNISRHLQPMSRAVTGAFRLLQGIRDSVRSWRDQV